MEGFLLFVGLFFLIFILRFIFKKDDKPKIEQNKINLEIKNDTYDKQNNISTILKIFSWLILSLGIVFGFIEFINTEDISNMFTVCIIYGSCSLIGFSFAEIIQLLQDIKNKLEKK